MCHIQDEGSFIDPNIETNKEVFEDDYEDGCYIDYGDFHAKMYNKPNPTIVINNTLPNQEYDQVRKFDSGAVRDLDKDKFDIEGFLNPLVLHRYFEYMHKHRNMSNGEKRDSDNWQLLFGEKHLDVCIKSLLRHAFDLWLHHREYDEKTTETL